MYTTKSVSCCCIFALLAIITATYILFDEDNISQQKTFYPKRLSHQTNQQFNQNVIPEEIKERKIIILFWKPLFGRYVKMNIDRKCGNCEVTYDTNHLETSDAVVIHFTEARKDSLPDSAKRHSNQMYVFFSMESPFTVSVLRGMQFDSLGPYFNWTMNYRRDSDIFFPVFEWFEGANIFNGDTSAQYSPKVVQDIISQKVSQPLALWMAGNCGSTHGAKLRMQLVDELEKAGLLIEKRGGCFGTGKTAPRGEAYKPFAVKFKFYLSFENAVHCRDYITEKLWKNALDSGLVPVVWGPKRQDVEELAPKGSFIFYEDFKSSTDLVQYLKYLDQNETAYIQYFNWRTKQPSPDQYKMVEHGVDYKRISGMCQMCKMLTEKNKSKNFSKIIQSLDQWWTGSERKECLSTTTPLHPQSD